jgi:tryptophanyl-tRNA synthetase
LQKGEYKKLKSLRDPNKKMSKSDADQNSRIELTDPPELIRKKIKKAITDSQSIVSYDPIKRPGVSTLVEIDSACSSRDPDEIVEDALLRGYDTGQYKSVVSQLLIDELKPIQEKYRLIMDDRKYLLKVLQNGAERANEMAAKNYKEICKLVGFCSH